MARKRMIDPNFWQSNDIAKLSYFARLVFIGLFTNADDEGRGRAKSAFVKSILFPYDETLKIKDIDSALGEIANNMSIVFYEINGNEFYQLTKWNVWQRIDRPSKSVIPPLAQGCKIIRRTLGEYSSNDMREVGDGSTLTKQNIKEEKENIDCLFNTDNNIQQHIHDNTDTRKEFEKPTRLNFAKFWLENTNHDCDWVSLFEQYEKKHWLDKNKNQIRDWQKIILKADNVEMNVAERKLGDLIDDPKAYDAEFEIMEREIATRVEWTKREIERMRGEQ